MFPQTQWLFHTVYTKSSPHIKYLLYVVKRIKHYIRSIITWAKYVLAIGRWMKSRFQWLVNGYGRFSIMYAFTSLLPLDTFWNIKTLSCMLRWCWSILLYRTVKLYLQVHITCILYYVWRTFASLRLLSIKSYDKL